jgi:hypothetical protein
MLVRNQLTSIQSDEISNNRVLLEKAPYFNSLFWTLRDLEILKVTNTRKEILAEKRHEKRSTIESIGPPTSHVPTVWVGPPAPALTAEERNRIISISDPSKSSAGSQLFHATQEQESELLGNLFCQAILNVLFLDDPSLNWVTGRVDALPVLRWRHRYSKFFFFCTAF